MPGNERWVCASELCSDSYHAICGNVGLLDLGGLLNGLLADDFTPVTIGVKNKGNVSHTAVGKLLLELVACILNALARCLNVVDTDAGVSEATVRLLVAVGDREVGVVLRAIVVSQLR